MGAVGAEQLGRRIGPGPFVILSAAVVAIAALCFPLVHTGDFLGVVALAATYFVLSAGNSSITVFAWTIRQTLTPSAFLGRMNGAFRFLVTGIMPFGAFFGGWLGESIGIRSTLFVSGVALILIAVSGRFTPLMKLKSLVVKSEVKGEK
jgi:MFS family permease